MFIHPALTWGFFLALVPLLIHLINLVRRRRVKWAAMNFLMQSYKKHQKWIWLQQLLLLLLRMVAIAVAVAMLAQWVAKSHWFALFGGRVTHHYVLLDDSFSMSERFGGASAFDKATQALSRIASQAMVQESAQKFTLVRFSRAAGFDKESTGTSIGQLADVNAERVDANFDVLLEGKRQGFAVTQLATQAREAFELAIELVRQSSDETNVLHVLSDFRHKDWSKPAELTQLLRDLDEATEQIHFINCAPETQQGNLAITQLQPAEGVRAAGVPLMVQVTVKNFGAENAAKIPIRIRTTYFDQQTVAAAEPGQPVGKIDETPAILIDDLAPGQITTRQFQVLFPQSGEHVVEAILPDDVVAADNRRWCVINTEDSESILVIESEGAQRSVSETSRSGFYYLQSAFEPGPRAVTGIRVVRERPAYLRDATPESLTPFRAIYLLDVDRLDDRAVENLEAFVRGGGGLGVFLGEHVNLGFYTTRLYREGTGVFPLPLERNDVLPADSDENVPDLEVVDHPIFSVLLGEQNPFIRLVNIDRYARPPLRWAPEPNSTVSILARLRNRQPLAVEKQFGEGRVIVFLTTISPQWNNWANDPSFVVVLLKLQSYLAAPERTVESRLVGAPLHLPLDGEKVRRDFVFVAPGPKSDLPLVLQRAAVEEKPIDAAKQEQGEPAAVRLTAVLPGMSTDDANSSRAGVYELWQTTVAGPLEVRRFALNVDPAESDIQQEGSQTLLASVSPIAIRMRRADELAFDLTEQAGFGRSGWLMLLLLVALLIEQFLAYIASYHPSPAEGTRR